MTKENEEARRVLGDVSAYLASRATLQNETLAGHTFIDICKAIKALEQQPEVGRWMRKTKVDGLYDISGVKTWGIKCQCDRCDFTTTVIEDFGYYTYCPNCGAKMEVEE